MALDELADWRLATALNVYEIALLMKGYNPSDFADEDPEKWDRSVARDTYAVVRAVQYAVESEHIEAKIQAENFDYIYWKGTMINVHSLGEWIERSNYADKFFTVGNRAMLSGILDSESPYFAIKLAAAIQAWEHVSSHPEALRGKRPKTAIKVWLKENAEGLGLMKPDGNPNETAISEIAAVANWDQAGGAPTTGLPTGIAPRLETNFPPIKPNPGKVPRKYTREELDDDDIPF